MEKKEKSMVGVIPKTFAILRAFVEEKSEWGVRDLAKYLGLTVTTLHRLVLQLKEEGVLEHNPVTNKYIIGTEMIRISSVIASENQISKVTRKYMEKISGEFNESVYLILYDNLKKRITFVDKVNGTNPLQYVINLGESLSLPYAAGGKCILAYLSIGDVNLILNEEGFSQVEKDKILSELELIRENGYSTSEGERVKGVMGVASPFLDHSKQPIGALACVIPNTRVNQALIEAVKNEIRDASSEISDILGYKPDYD
ncbi:IclR family transcriptional regulator [Bacillus sp. Marseille-P3661]|uniref:IclR family transcriptional regulator n=1 Tax=Bacillus sp. Marseille-P3661 TaxID=1936234 RepID=UPI000C84C757|nr:IclR family transcriptional regulator [Bacillus sp. Marseille-P3661]